MTAGLQDGELHRALPGCRRRILTAGRRRHADYVVLVGPSGFGKSTCLSMIAGLEDVTEGELRIGGRVVTSWPQGPRHRHGVPELRLYPHMTLRDNKPSLTSWPG
jgi:ABC-type sulfate/molybdate transport systems ATPase subunit